jgi:DNA-binding ferritin-like protein
MLDRLKIMSEVGRSRLGRLGMIDPVSQDQVSAVLADMEKQLWMFEANRPEVEGE